MPYIITTSRDLGEEDGQIVTEESRRAVATLDAARDEAFERMADVPRYRLDTAARISDLIHDLPESGGTVGPLPDGTVIEVERVKYSRIATEGGFDFAGPNPGKAVAHRRIIAAYNAAHS